jgi:hypothetical protein
VVFQTWAGLPVFPVRIASGGGVASARGIREVPAGLNRIPYANPEIHPAGFFSVLSRPF